MKAPLSVKFFAVVLIMVLLSLAWHWSAALHAQTPGVATVASISAASYSTVVAPESIVAAFSANLAATLSSATDFDPSTPGIQLPTLLGGISVEVNGRSAGLFYTSPGQINYQVPPDLEPGTGYVTVRSDKGAILGAGAIEIRPNAPAIFTANATGQGVPAAVLFRLKANGAQSYESIARFQDNRYVPLPIDLGPPGERVFLILYLTGARRVAKASDTRLLIGGAEFQPLFIGASSDFVGVEQLNFELPRHLKGRLSFVLSAIGHPTSNVCEIEIAPPIDQFDPNPVPPKVNGLNVATALAGEVIEISGSGFSTHPSEVPEVLVADSNAKLFNAQVTETTSTRLRAIVPFGAGTGRLIVRNPRGESAVPIAMRTSVSGTVQSAQVQANGQTIRTGLRNVTVRAFTSSGVIERRTNDDGAFLLPDVPPSSRMELEIDATTTGLPYPKPRTSIRVNAGRDNKFEDYLELKLITGASVPTVQAGVLPDAAFNVAAAASPTENEATGQTGQVVFEPNGSTATLPDGTRVSELKVTPLDVGRTPANLPETHFSSVIAQITPFGARLTPGGKLTFPNPDGLAAGSAATLFRYDQTAGSATLGQFVAAGTVTVSADGQRVETARDAIKETTYYFVSVARTTTTIYGSVVEEDDTPARGALVQVRGKSVFALTDDNGAFILTNVPVLTAEELTLEVSYLRPDGTVDRAERAGVRPGGSALAFVSPPIVLTGRGRTRAPVVLAPRFLTVEAGRTADFNFIAYARGTQVTLRGVTVAGAAFASVNAVSGDRYNLRLAPNANTTGNFTLTITARDSQNAETTEAVLVEVKAANSNQPLANSQSLITDEDRPLNLILQGSGGTVYRLVSPPRRGTLSGTVPNLVYTPEANYNGLDSFSFTVSNGTATSSAAVVTLAIRPTDDAPRLDVGAVYTTNIGTALNVVINGFDVDAGQRLTLTAANLPTGATIAQTTATSWLLSWTPKFDQLGSYAVNLTLRDDGVPVLSDSRTVTIVVDAKWAGMSQVGSSTTFSFAALGNILFAGTNSGVYRTTDNGVSWTAVNNGLGNRFVNVLTIKDNALFAGTLNGVYRSTNSGASWHAVNNGLVGERDVFALIVKGSMLFAGTENEGVFRSEDNGANWVAVNNGLTAQDVRTLVVKDNMLFAGTNGAGVFRTTDNGANWSVATNGLENQIVRALIVKGDTLFAGTHNGVYRTTDNGARWTIARNGLGTRRVFSLIVKDEALIAGTSSGVFRTADNGTNWSGYNTGIENLVVYGLGVKDAVLFAGTNFGVYRLIDNNASWNAINGGLGDQTVNALLAKDNALFAGTGGSGIFRSTDNGVSWAAVNNGYIGGFVFDLIVKDNVILVGAERGVYRSTDDGTSWTTVIRDGFGTDLTAGIVYALVVKGSLMFAATGNGVYRTTDNGASWMVMTSGIGRQRVNRLTVKGNELFAVVNSRVYRTADDGATWTQVSGGLERRSVRDLIIKGDTIFAGASSGVYCSKDNGANWSAVNDGMGSQSVYAFTIKDNSLFAGTLNGVFRTTNDGESWTAVSNGLGNPFVTILTVKGDMVFAVTDGRIHSLAESAQIWAESNTDLANRFVNATTFVDNTFFVGTEKGVFSTHSQIQSWSFASTGLPPAADVRAFTSINNGTLAGLADAGVYFSNDQGRNWTARNTGLSNRFVNALASEGATVYAGTQGGMFRSFDGGVNWAAANSGLTRATVLSLTISGNAVYAGTDNGLFRSTNQGASWTAVNAGLSDLYIVSLGVAPDGTSLLAGTSSGMFRSTNQGTSWTAVTQGLPERVVALTFAQQRRRLLAGTVNGFFVSEDNGVSWRQINGGLLTLQVGALAVNGDTVLAGTRSGGVFVSTLPQ